MPRWPISPQWLLLLPAFIFGAALGHGAMSAQPPLLADAAAAIHYAPGEDLGAVVEALREAAGRGVRVRIWRDAGMAAKVGEHDVEAELGGPVPGLEVRSKPPGGELMHLKDYCVDHRLLRTGSANFSRSSETRQDNDLVALRGMSVCAGFDAKFDRAWGKS